MLDGVSQRNQPAEADAAEENRDVAELIDQESERCDLVILTDLQRGLVGGALAEKVECGNAKSFRDQRVPIDAPEFGVLRQPVDQHIGRPALRTDQLKAYAIGAEGKERHGAPNETRHSMSGPDKRPLRYVKGRRRRRF